MMAENYYFYGSFENTIYHQYVTEKFARPFKQSGIIPVVYGGSDYSQFAPSHTYIDANDFDTPEQLSTFLISLSQNSREYIKYFWWTKHYKVTSTNMTNLFCNICMEVHKRKTTGRIAYYKNIVKYVDLFNYSIANSYRNLLDLNHCDFDHFNNIFGKKFHKRL